MTSASRLFYLTIFTLWASPGTCAAGSDADYTVRCSLGAICSAGRGVSNSAVLHISPKSIVQDACASCSTLEELNQRVKPALDDLTQTTDFFSYYRLNLFNKKCPFWNDENGFCGNIGCAVETVDNEEDIPEVWRAKELSKLEGPRAKHPGKQERKEHLQRPLHGELGDDVGESCVVEYDDECDERDYCVLEDEGASFKGDYVSLLRNPERFTGYGGEGAKQVWDAIYRENCFQRSSFSQSANLGQSLNYNAAAQDFKHVMDAAGRQAQLEAQRLQHPDTPFVASTGYEADDDCLEKRVFYRVISGMHASISTHLCWDFLNQTTGQWQPNLQCYKDRLHAHPDRISNLYFNYALVTRAVAKLGPELAGPEYVFCTGDPAEDLATRVKVSEVAKQAGSIPQIFDESLMFVNGECPSLKEDFRNRFRNVSRLMDCVGCDKCRLWGKIQTNGYGTALKILFEMDNHSNKIPVLKRTELVALFNTYARLASSMQAIGKFRQMMEAASEPVAPKDGKPKEAPGETHDSSDSYSDPTHHWRLLEDMKRRGAKSDSFRDQWAHETALIKQSLKVVLHGWLHGSILLYRIAVVEAHRLWLYFLGLQPGPGLVEYRWAPKDKKKEL
ncbi:endoplasmic oxidoreductin-1 precursor [Metarhizium album ARSEF 1941]|uniref:Endoplasmic oxidoreductin-1 n=1 Tax=Metarhizium album (strain ARSEF 1941) TaxID=1081103 RepID=A0A0B2WML9_METAS|nr:endoplasmic oxidoreductin-1 precursor [Metarhizium album ARSEF 1941]KHN94732.1 endoplasmic oxidoreductin-1 precursor [Metarhizium album ARSEF 1941]